MKKTSDWKDVAESYYEKTFALAILFVLFTFMVFDKITVNAYEQFKVSVTNSVYVPEPEKVKVDEPVITVLPRYRIVADDELEGLNNDVIDIPAEIVVGGILTGDDEIKPSHVDRDPVRVYDDMPVPLITPNVIYPELEKKIGIEGAVVLDVVVLTDGTVGEIVIFRSSGSDNLDKAAIDAARQYIYQPARTNGKPVPVWLKIPFKFSIRK